MNRNARFVLVTAVAAGFAVSFWVAPPAHGRAMEKWGNDPLAASNYNDWPNIMPDVNHRSRVYHQWVNGSEWFYYRGDTDALNAALRAFAQVLTQPKLIVLRPGPAEANTFDKDKRVAYDWSMHLLGGVSKAFAAREDISNPWTVFPTITVRVGANVELDKIDLPDDVTVMHTAGLVERLRLQIEKADDHKRAYASGELVNLDPYSRKNAELTAALLKSDDPWVLRIAASTTAGYGHLAKSALPALREGLKHEDERVRERFAEAIEIIENAEEDTEAAEAHRVMVRRIARFVEESKEAAP